MSVRLFVGITLCCLIATSLLADPPSAADLPTEVSASTAPATVSTESRDRSPLAVAVSPDRRFALTTNHTGDSVTLVDLATRTAVHELACGSGPLDAVWVTPELAVVSLLHDDALAVLQRHGKGLTIQAVIPVGDEPRGLAVVRPFASAPDSDGDNATSRVPQVCVAVSGADEVAFVDLQTHTVTRRISVGGIPRTLAVSPDQQWLITCCSVPAQVFVHEIATGKEAGRRYIFDEGFTPGVPLVLPDSSACIVPSQVNRTFRVTENNIEKGWVLDNRLTKLRLPHGEYWEQKQLGLDVRGKAVGDAHAVALSPDGRWLVVTCGGTHELLMFRYPDLKWPGGYPGDFLPEELRYDEDVFRRLPLQGRPQGVQFIDDRTAIVANYLSNSLQFIDVAAGRITDTLALGSAPRETAARRGERIFYDAERSLHGWFSCHTCHTDGHTSGTTFDTVNDDSYDTYKLTPSLRGVTETGPWTWHGWQTSLAAAMRKSLTDTLSTGHEIHDADVDDLLAFLQTLKHPPSPMLTANGQLSTQAQRGKIVFETKGACTTCHQRPHYTSPTTYLVGLESSRDSYEGFNPPSLRGLHSKRLFLHDGRTDSLTKVFKIYHRPEKLAGEKLTDAEIADLIAYLKSL